jgi:Cu+-exporting ATPase
MCEGVESDRPDSCPKCGMALEPETPSFETRTEYICPMHPEVVRDEPGDCPICGMALEPNTVQVDPGPDPELVDMTRRFVGAALFTLPVLVLAMGDMVLPGSPVHDTLPAGTGPWLELLFALPVCLWSAWPFYVRGIRSVANRALNMFTLIGLGVSVAFGYSVVATVAPGLFPDAFRHADGRVGVYFEAATMIVTLILLGQVLGLRARSATGAVAGLCPGVDGTVETSRRMAVESPTQRDRKRRFIVRPLRIGGKQMTRRGPRDSMVAREGHAGGPRPPG